MGFSGFQANGFQNNGFQIARQATGPVLLGGKAYSYVSPHARYQEQQAQIAKRRQEAQLIENEIALKEKQQQEAKEQIVIAETKRQGKAVKKLMALGVTLQEEINRLRTERIWLVRLIDDDEAILVIMMKRTFH